MLTIDDLGNVFLLPEIEHLEPHKRLAAVMDFLEEHPERHEQSCWVSAPGQVEVDPFSCGTTGCLAGWGVMLMGYKPDRTRSYCSPDGSESNESLIRGTAVEVFGLTEEQGDVLFKDDIPASAQRAGVDLLLEGGDPNWVWYRGWEEENYDG